MGGNKTFPSCADLTRKQPMWASASLLCSFAVLGFTYLWLARNEEIEKNMKTTIPVYTILSGIMRALLPALLASLHALVLSACASVTGLCPHATERCYYYDR